MTIARLKSEWQRTALQTTILANQWSAKKITVSDFPYCGLEQKVTRIDSEEKLKTFINIFWKANG